MTRIYAERNQSCLSKRLYAANSLEFRAFKNSCQFCYKTEYKLPGHSATAADGPLAPDQTTRLVGIDPTNIDHVARMLFGLVSKQHPLYANQSVQSHDAKTGPRFLIPQRLLQPRNFELRHRHGSTLDRTDSPLRAGQSETLEKISNESHHLYVRMRPLSRATAEHFDRVPRLSRNHRCS